LNLLHTHLPVPLVSRGSLTTVKMKGIQIKQYVSVRPDAFGTPTAH
jgi:hypothetical protein